MSLDDIRDQVLSNAIEESVNVNHRLLIDKILARYSSEYVIYRELMQNSDDAKSSSIQIIFETEPHEKAEKITRIQFKNNGFAFRIEDWNRLRSIAEGNPDEQKIGAFGVGFYSLFSVCDNPFVSSGGQGMAFYWRGNQLFTKQGPVDDKDNGWTTFLMDMNEPIELPDHKKFAQFLSNSLLFTVYLQEISLYFNDELVMQLSKKLQKPKSMGIRPGTNTYSPEKMFHLISLDVRDVQLSVKFQTEDPTCIFFRIACGYLDAKISDTFSAEMERIIKKKPPSKTTIQMIFTGFEDHENNKNVSPVFKDLLQYPKQGRIYIGFSTSQTTGCCSHLSIRVIPTMERESIDLANETLAKYNKEMLSLSGTLSRILYEDEMDQIAGLFIEKIGAHPKDDEDTESIRELLERRAAHALSHFTFKPSTPNEKIGQIAESRFSSCLRPKISILSTNGVCGLYNVRMPNQEIDFVKNVSFIPKIILDQCSTFIKREKGKFHIRDLNLDDVINELRSRILPEDEFIKLLKWWITYRSHESVTSSIKLLEFMRLARIGNDSRSLDTIRYVLNPGIIPPDVDIPEEVLPYTISKNFKNPDQVLLKEFLGLSELSLVDWAEFIVQKPELENDPAFAERVHQILAKNLNNTAEYNKEIISRLFAQKKCIPTNFGMKIPSETYFNSLSPDLPTIQFQKPLSVRNLMELLGVQKFVGLDIILNRLNSKNGQENWDHIQLTKYLASISDSLKEHEIDTLKNKPIWPKENSAESQSNSNELEGENSKQHFIAEDLHAPITIHRDLGLPVIDMKGKWSNNSPEAKILLKLGLRGSPTLKKILELAAPPTDPNIRSKALNYFIENFEKRYKDDNYDPAKIDIEFLPCLGPNAYAKPSECFINSDCMIMNFKVIDQSLRFQVEKLGVRQNPDRQRLLDSLIKHPPKDEDNGKKIFEYLTSQLTQFNFYDWDRLSKSKFIPIRDKITNEDILVDSHNCFFKIQDEMFNGLFSHVDFGEMANKFLQSCKVKDEPSLVDIAELLITSSHRLWKSIGDDVERYLDILRKIGNNYGTLIKDGGIDLITKMMNASILVAIKKDIDDNEVNRYSLASSEEIFINKDSNVYQKIFNPLTAPEDVVLETLYKKLECRSLRDSVEESSTPKGTERETEKSQHLQETIIERASLFYYNQHKNKIKKDEEWLKKLKVREIDYIETTYTLGNTKVIKENDTYVLQDKADSCTLYITSKSSDLSISQQMTKCIFKSDEWNNVFCFHALLVSKLSALKDMGYPVDRILKSKQQVVVEESSAEDNSFHKSNNNNNNSNSNSNSNSNNSSHDPNDTSQSQSFKSNIKLTNKKSINVTYNTAQKLRISLQDSLKSFYSKSRKVDHGDKDITKANSNFNGIVTYLASVEIDFEDKQIDYCEKPDYLLLYVETIQEIKLYIPEGFDRSEISQEQTASLSRFIKILKNLAKVFELVPKDIHIFYDNDTNSIAFIHDRVLFFNLKFYIGLHDEECKTKPTVAAMTYWFMMFCHELAHNFVAKHDSNHEYIYLSITEIYMSNFLERLKKRVTFA